MINLARVQKTHPSLAQALAAIRQSTGFSQNRFAQELALISGPAWIKIEAGNRDPSDSLLDGLVKWLVNQRRLETKASGEVARYLKALKYLGNRVEFVRRLAAECITDHWESAPVPFVAGALASGK